MAYKQNIVTYNQPSTSPPINPKVGDTWWQPNGGKFCRYVSTGQWVCTENLKGGEYGYIMGNWSTITNAAYKIDMTTDSGYSTAIGNLNFSSYSGMSCNSSTYIYHADGNSTYTTTNSSTIEKLNPATDTFSVISGALSIARCSGAAVNSSLHGYVIGGFAFAVSTGKSTIDTINFATDSVANSGGNLSISAWSFSAFNSSVAGYTVGGIAGASDPNMATTIARLTYPFTAGTTAVAGNLSASTSKQFNGFNSSISGYTSYYNTSAISRLIFSADSTLTIVAGYAPGVTIFGDSFNSTTFGFISGAGISGITTTSVCRLTFGYDNGSANVIKTLLKPFSNISGADNTDFVSMFV